MAAYLEESATRSIFDGDIQTVFSKEQEFLFQTYEPTGGLFTWATASESATTEVDPIIYVSTPQNMSYFENESLSVAGLGGYIKFADAATAEKCTQSETLDAKCEM